MSCLVILPGALERGAERPQAPAGTLLQAPSPPICGQSHARFAPPCLSPRDEGVDERTRRRRTPSITAEAP